VRCTSSGRLRLHATANIRLKSVRSSRSSRSPCKRGPILCGALSRGARGRLVREASDSHRDGDEPEPSGPWLRLAPPAPSRQGGGGHPQAPKIHANLNLGDVVRAGAPAAFMACCCCCAASWGPAQYIRQPQASESCSEPMTGPMWLSYLPVYHGVFVHLTPHLIRARTGGSFVPRICHLKVSPR
jgi:hypothetical protein